MITYFHRNLSAGFSINKVTQTVIRTIPDKIEYYMPEHGGSILVRLRNIVFTYKRRNKQGINHVTGDIHYCIMGLIGCKSVLTVHDLVWLEYLQMNKFKRFIIYLLYVRLPLLFATKVVAISEVTKRGLQKYTNRKDIEVIHNALDESFKAVLKDQNIKPKNVLFIGTSSNKNLERTVCALRGLDCLLTIIGKLSLQQIEYLNESGVAYKNRVNLSDEEIVEEYINCDIVSFISLYEGFGMPIIEANKVGRPVVCADIPVLREVAGEAALFVNPTDINDMRNGFKMLFEDSGLRNQLVQKGLDNVKRFDVELIRSKWIELYNSI